MTTLQYAVLWFREIAEHCDNLTSGNVSHNGGMIRGYARDAAHYIRTSFPSPTDDTLKDKAVGWFEDIYDLSLRLTSGNVSHMAATIKGKAIRAAEFIEKRL